MRRLRLATGRRYRAKRPLLRFEVPLSLVDPMGVLAHIGDEGMPCKLFHNWQPIGQKIGWGDAGPVALQGPSRPWWPPKAVRMAEAKRD
jgi:hypothetical protein